MTLDVRAGTVSLHYRALDPIARQEEMLVWNDLYIDDLPISEIE
jgi:hypothetical protein